MLQTLQIKNFALFSSAKLDFSSGISIFTGETGAGKSLFMSAIGMLAGNRATGEYIRQGEDSFFIEGVFSYTKEDVRTFMEAHNIPLEEDVLIISRRFTRSGKGNILANGVHITRSVLQELASYLLDIHDQFHHYSIFEVPLQRQILDSADEELLSWSEEYQEKYKRWLSLEKEKRQFYEKIQREARERDILSFQIKEITTAALRQNEDKELEEKVLFLQNKEKIQTALEHTVALLTGDTEEGLISKLRQACHELSQASRSDTELNQTTQQLETTIYELEDIQGQLQSRQDSWETTESLDIYEQRLYQIQQLKRKYGDTIEEILAFGAKAQSQWEELENKEEVRHELEEKSKALEKELRILSTKLQKKREEVSKIISANLENCLRDLGMNEPKIVFQCKAMTDIAPYGADHIELYFSSNPGEPVKPLAKVGSGGEASRIALALKCIMPKKEDRTVILDEIDVGISGNTAIQVAYKIEALGKDTQVFCITHLPQTAAAADTHFYLYKDVVDGRTFTHVTQLSDEEHIQAVASIFAGSTISEDSRKTAAHLINQIKK